MTVDDIERLIRRLERTDIHEFEVSDATSSLVLHLAPAAAASSVAGWQSPTAPPEPGRVLRSPGVGRLRLQHPEAAASQPVLPRSVVEGEVVAFVEAGCCLRPLIADADGTLVPLLVADGCLVGYATPLFRILPPASRTEP